jgi:hypothetical protein
MFERNRVDNADQGYVAVELMLTGGQMLVGKVVMAAGRNIVDFLNNNATFVEFEPYDGDKSFLAKSSIRSVRVLQVPKGGNLNQRLRDLDGFDPWQILSVERGTSWEDTRSAYHRLAKIYHPDRYATAELPDEVKNYLSGMARRVNAAYSALEASQAQKRQFAGLKQEPIYTSSPR